MNIFLLNINIEKGWGGMESHSASLAALLSRNGHNMVMGCWVEGSVSVARDIILPSRKVTIRNSGDIRAVFKIIQIVLKEKIQVIIANDGREYWPAVVAARITGSKIILIRHQTDKLKWTTCWLINRSVYQVIAVSGAVKKVLIQSGVLPEKVKVIYNSASLERFEPSVIDKYAVRRELGINEKDIVVGSAGKLHIGKGVLYLLSAFSLLSEKYSNLKLLYVGDGPAREELEREAQRLSLKERVIFTGVRQDTERLYAAMDIFVIPSAYEEAFGMVLIEAMAMGKPVIATYAGGIPEIVTNEISGLLVPQKDPQAIANAISRYINDADFSRRVAAEGRRVVEHKFSDKTMVDNFERTLKQIF